MGKHVAWCENCDGRKCMDCVLRVVHDECEDSCPFCCDHECEAPGIPASLSDEDVERIARAIVKHLPKQPVNIPWQPVMPTWPTLPTLPRIWC